jgi:hypothetical protein
MNKTDFRTFSATLEDLARDIVEACRRAVRAIAVMPLPTMLACCIGLAFVISLLPLALCLFVLFLGIKLVAGAFIVDHRRAHREHYGKQ